MVGLKSLWLSQHWVLGVVLPSFLWIADQCSVTSKRQVELMFLIECLGKKKENYNTEHFYGIPFLWVLRRRKKNNQRYKILSSQKTEAVTLQDEINSRDVMKDEKRIRNCCFFHKMMTWDVVNIPSLVFKYQIPKPSFSVSLMLL